MKPSLPILCLLTLLATVVLAQRAFVRAPGFGGGINNRPTKVVSTNSLEMWFDFNDTTDSHASLDLTEVNSPSYTNEGDTYYGIADQAGTNMWRHDSHDIGTTDEDFTFVTRWRGYGAATNGDMPFRWNNGRNFNQWYPSTDKMGVAVAKFARIDISHTTDTNVWYSVVMQWDSSETNSTVWINGGSETSTNSAGVFGVGTGTIGGFYITTPEDFEFDYFGCFKRLLTEAERDAIGTNTFEYSDFLP